MSQNKAAYMTVYSLELSAGFSSSNFRGSKMDQWGYQWTNGSIKAESADSQLSIGTSMANMANMAWPRPSWFPPWPWGVEFWSQGHLQSPGTCFSNMRLKAPFLTGDTPPQNDPTWKGMIWNNDELWFSKAWNLDIYRFWGFKIVRYHQRARMSEYMWDRISEYMKLDSTHPDSLLTVSEASRPWVLCSLCTTWKLPCRQSGKQSNSWLIHLYEYVIWYNIYIYICMIDIIGMES